MKHAPPATNNIGAILNEAVQRLLTDEPLMPFTDWFSAQMLATLQAESPVPPADLDDALRYQRHVARQLWGHMPVPSNRWRARGLPKVERNDVCPCGSGRKFKQCCAVFEHAPMPLPTNALLPLALDAAEPHMLSAEKIRLVPAQALGMAAMNWNLAGQTDKTLGVLTPLFASPKALDARHEIALDALIDAMQQLGQNHARRQLLEHMVQHHDKVLATAARCRLVSVLADQGEDAQAWKLFHETSRFNPNDPQLWPLEMTLLLSQGRQEEARLRAPLLAAQARKAGRDDLAGALVQMAQEGIASIYSNRDDAEDDTVELAWLALADATPRAPDREALHALYKVERFDLQDGDQQATTVSIRPVKKLADLNLRWRRRFLVGKPDMTWLDADVETLLFSLPAALAFLEKNPAAWLSAEVLDDLLLAAYALCNEHASTSMLKAAQRVADHALAVLRLLVGEAQFHWIESTNRPLLRCLAVAVELARMAHDDVRSMDLLHQGLALNPHDNHGWRLQLAPLLLKTGRYQDALDLMAQYPHDMPPSEHLRALALLCLGRKNEAEAVLREAHQRYPHYLNTLLPETQDPPPDEPGPGVALGGALAAWYHRLDWRPLWVRSGALAWARQLNLPEPSPPRARQPAVPRKSAARGATEKKVLVTAFGEKDEKRLKKTCTDYPRLHGLLQAVAWSPQMLLPNAWLRSAMELHDRMPNSRTEATAQKALNDTLSATMRLYNHLNQQVMDHHNQEKPPLDELIQLVSPSADAVFAWTAGFLQGCELSLAAWARTGHKVTGQTGSFGRLRALAARAPVQHPQDRVQQDDGKPLLLALDEECPAATSLLMALSELWPVAAAARRAGGG
ncbi:MAG: UPF0149 family protein [Hydrogenophaga sp.]|uniref:UPF0149 family protein n=1 Tax=Hydrogenophaga sp. TaxID=1904254 RepID=UPI002720533D|nr:UPF0149 family protein [Hydrogenophaga sp.]MDO9146295.1 UPF0149 family protein [Hydrogenophaga sp.]MDO9604694.1 UPF0149 family protein [Hydrogenophaga sp.]